MAVALADHQVVAVAGPVVAAVSVVEDRQAHGKFKFKASVVAISFI